MIIRNLIDVLLVLIISILLYIIFLPKSFIGLYLFVWVITGNHFLTSLIFIFTLILLTIKLSNKLEKNNFYKEILIGILLLSIVFFSIFLCKIIGLTEEYLLFINFIVIDSDNNIITGIGIGISALLAVFSMLYQLESNKIDKMKEIQTNNLTKITTFENIIKKILVLVQTKKNLLISDRDCGDICTNFDDYLTTTKLIRNDLKIIVNYYEYLKTFENLNNLELSLSAFENEIKNTNTKISLLIESFEKLEDELIQLKNDIKEI